MMTLKQIFSFLVIGCLITCTLQAQVGEFSREEISKKIKIQRLVMSYISLKQFSGVVTVLIDGKEKPLYQYTTGFANLDYHVPNSLTALYNLCELSQTLTATAIMQLVEQKKLDLQVPISTYLPDIAAKIGQPITIHQLLTHTAGLPNYYESESYMNNFLDINTIDDLLTLILEHPLDFTPGSAVNSSPSNYVLLAALIEKVTGLRYVDYIPANVFKRANMDNAALYSWRDIIDNRGVGYTFDEEGAPILPATFWGAYPFGADAIYSDSHSLLAFADAFHNNQLVSKETKEQMLKNYVYFDGENKTDGFSYGWRTKSVFGQKVVYHGGELQGLSIQLRRYIKDKYTFIVLSNYHNNKAEEIAFDIEQALCNPDYIAPGHPVSLLVQKAIENEGITKTLAKMETLLAECPVKLDKVWALNSLGKAYLDAGKTETAAALFEVNAEKFPNDPEVYGSLGDAHFQLKNYDRAISSFEKRISLSPNDKWAIGMLKRVQKKKAEPVEIVVAPKEEKPVATNVVSDTPTDATAHTSDIDQADVPASAIVQTPTAPIIAETPAKAVSETVTKETPVIAETPAKAASEPITEKTTNSSEEIELIASVPKPTVDKADNTETISIPNLPNTTADGGLPTPTPEITFESEFYSDPPAATPTPNLGATPIPSPNPTATNIISSENTTTKPSSEEETIVRNAATESRVYVVVDEMPKFPGGKIALRQYWKDNLRYPESAKANGVEGIVNVSFIVETNGALKNIRIHKGMIGGGNGCNNEALRLVRSMPNWTSGNQQGLPARVFYTLAVPFEITD